MNQAQNEMIVLAFSGGLDTSYCVRVLLEQGYRVHTAFVNAGGVSEEDSQWIRQRALSLGAEQHHEIDAAEDIWNEFVIPLVWSGARMLGEYPMLCSDRYVIVRRCLELCTELGTRHFAHGCTGMGNDQLRFDQTVRSLGDFELHAPIRDLGITKSRFSPRPALISRSPARSTRSMKICLVLPFQAVKLMSSECLVRTPGRWFPGVRTGRLSRCRSASVLNRVSPKH
jgi:argininosuccinate synthase